MALTHRIWKFENHMRKQSLSFFAFSQSRYAMDWRIEDAKSIDDFTTSASLTGKPMPDFENLDFKSARGVRKILTGNVKKQVTTAERTAQSEKRLLTGRQIAWMIFDFLNISGDNEAILEFKDLSKVKERQRSSLRHRVGRCIISIY